MGEGGTGMQNGFRGVLRNGGGRSGAFEEVDWDE